MINAKIIEDIINNLDPSEVLQINYKGFTGRGINGVMHKAIYVCDIEKEDSIVNYKTVNSASYRTKMQAFLIREEIVMGVYQDYIQKYKHSDWEESGGEYAVIVPYESIESMEIYTLESE